jgi:hypothetical protein
MVAVSFFSRRVARIFPSGVGVRTTDSTTARSAARACSGRFAARVSRPSIAARSFAVVTLGPLGVAAERASWPRRSAAFSSSVRSLRASVSE